MTETAPVGPNFSLPIHRLSSYRGKLMRGDLHSFTKTPVRSELTFILQPYKKASDEGVHPRSRISEQSARLYRSFYRHTENFASKKAESERRLNQQWPVIPYRTGQSLDKTMGFKLMRWKTPQRIRELSAANTHRTIDNNPEILKLDTPTNTFNLATIDQPLSTKELRGFQISPICKIKFKSSKSQNTPIERKNSQN